MEQYEQLICSILRGETAVWPDDPEFIEEDFFRACSEHGVAALVYYLLVQSGSLDGWPKNLIEKLQYNTMQLSAAELLWFKEQQAILELFNNKGIVPVLMKGAALSYSHYPSPGFRQRCDTDLFIGVDDIEPVQRTMQDRGYAIDYPLLKSHQFTCYRKSDGDFLYCFDIHWRISNESRFAKVIWYEEAVRDSVTVPLLPGVRVLCNLHALVLACVHLMANPLHNTGRLLWIYDIHLLATAMSDEELVKFAEFAVNKKVQDVCHQSLLLSRERFQTKLPDNIGRILSTSIVRAGFSDRFRLSNLGLYLDDLKILPGARLKGLLVKELMFPPPWYLLSQYGKTNILWYPLLLFQHTLGGMVKRLTLK